LNVTPVPRLVGSVIDTGPVTTDHVAVPLLAWPASVNAVVLPFEHWTWSAPASAVGLPFTASTTSSVAVGHGGLAALVTVSRSVAVPVPVKVTPECGSLGSAIAAGPLTTDHAAEPLLALPASVKE